MSNSLDDESLSFVTHRPVAPLGASSRGFVRSAVSVTMTVVGDLGKGGGADGRKSDECRECAHGFDF